MKVRPIGERVILKPMKIEEKTAAGIYLPEDTKEEKKQGIVEEVGRTSDGKELPLKKGDKVLYGGYSADEFEINNEKFLIVDFKDILAVIEN